MSILLVNWDVENHLTNKSWVTLVESFILSSKLIMINADLYSAIRKSNSNQIILPDNMRVAGSIEL